MTEQQELWAIEQGFDEIVVKTKNKFYDMRGTLDHLRFEVVKYDNLSDNAQSKVYFEQEVVAESPRRAPQREDGRAGTGIAMAPTTNYSKDLGDREPLAAMGDSVARLTALTRGWSAATSNGAMRQASGRRAR